MRPESLASPPDSLIDAAGLVADGIEPDWGSVSSRLDTDHDRALADQLALLARIAGEHRRLHQILPMIDAARTADRAVDRAREGTQWGHLELIEVLGRGSYGTVYRAWDPRLERHVALKLFHGASDPDAVMREGRMLARIQHDNVVAVHGADVVDGVAGIWMDLVRGRNLEQIVNEQGPMSAQEATLVGLDLARALAAVHKVGLVHCDVKAQNVVRESGGRLVLMDLGAGRPRPDADSAASKGLIGTPRYMAPELFAGAASSSQSDLYAVGVLLYYLVSGQFPVDGKTVNEIRRAHQEQRRSHLRDVRPDLPTGFLQEVSKALERDPAARHQTAGELEAGLLRLIAPATDIAAPLTEPRPAPSRKWASLTSILAIALLVAAVATGVNALRTRSTTTTATLPNVRTIAVMPMRNLTGDPSKRYIADGVTEVLIANLGRIKALRVPSSSAVMGYRDNPPASRQVATDLGADVLLAGSIMSVGDQLRIGVELIDPRSDTVMWSQELTKATSELLAAQGEIARLVAARLSIDLSRTEASALRQVSRNPNAVDAYLRGLAATETVVDLRSANEALSHLRHATDLEPTFAEAWAQQALAELRLIEVDAGANRAERAANVKVLAERALSLSPNSVTGLLALGSAQFYHDWDLPAAERTLRLALDHAPGSVVTLRRLSMLLAAAGRHEEAIAAGEQARDLEPLLPSAHTSLGLLRYYARDFAQAEAEMQRALVIAPGFSTAHFGLGRVYSAAGRHEEAIARFEQALVPVRRPSMVVELARAHAAAGHREQVRLLLAELEERQRRGEGFSLDNLAYIAAAEGRPDEALAILERAVDQKLTNVLWISVDPRVDSLRGDPRFERILSRVGYRR